MSKLIALVATAVIVGGERTVIQPGEPLPDLGKHDERELLQSGAIERQADKDAIAKADAAAVAAAEADFAAARKRAEEEEAARAKDAAEAKAVAEAKSKAAPKATGKK